MILFLSGLAADASTATLVECTVQVDHADQSWVVAGWGMTPEGARQAAWDEARIAAELVEDRGYWGGTFFEDGAVMGDVERGLTVTVDGQPTPGVTLTAGACTEQAVQAQGRWSVGWGDGPTVERADPASALSAARHVACLPPAKETAREGFRAVAWASEAEKPAMWARALTDAVDPALACWTAATPVPVAEGSQVADVGWFRCTAPSWGESGVPQVETVGWGDTLDAAAADAARASVLGGLLSAQAQGSVAISQASPETSQTLRAVAFTDWMLALGSASDGLRQAGLVCERGQVPASAQVSWAPADTDELRDCGVAELSQPTGVGASPAALRETVRQRCDVHRDLGHQLMSQAAGYASDETRAMLVHAGWSVVSRCEAKCLGHHAIADVQWTPAPLVGQPDRSSAEAAAESVTAAVAAQDAAALMRAVPWLLRMVEERGLPLEELLAAAPRIPLDAVEFRGHWLIKPVR